MSKAILEHPRRGKMKKVCEWQLSVIDKSEAEVPKSESKIGVQSPKSKFSDWGCHNNHMKECSSNKHFESSQKLLKLSIVNEIFKKIQRFLKSC